MDNLFDVHNKYKGFIGKPNEYSVCESRNDHLLNINLLKNLRKEEIDSFMGHYVKAFRILEPRIRSMRHWILVSEIGGHIEVNEPGFKEVEMEWQSEVDVVLRYYQNILELENDIALEYQQLAKDKNKKIKNDFKFKSILNSTVSISSGGQLKMQF